ncbi:hypothetical protein A8L59_03555 [Pseudomonas koreensis]|uniref:Uncharacterized protein n=1 Tax=Pseudomonas koreensis TaxID=198620 RepID=A0AAC9BR92_9PSED|nr:hypothetical protein [Pseudomonas koreensis]ANH96488.1 hypothetical protein A8L59_03555 [Pseudomonas koreensis]
MGQDVANGMKSKIKAPLLWLLGIVLTAVITKAVEDHFQWSFFSPIISLLWAGVVGICEWLAQPVSFPLWFVALSILSLLGVLVMVFRTTGNETQKLKAAEAKIADLLNPKLPRLNDDQRRVLSAIASFIERQHYANFRELKETLGFSHIVTEGAIDVLRDEGLITWLHNHRGVYEAGLTARGRACILYPGFLTESQDNQVPL